MVSNSSPSSSSGGILQHSTEICPDHFGFECSDTNCCASYHQRFIMLLFSLGIFLVALAVLVVWLAIEFRPAKRARPPPVPRDKRALSEVEIKSNEETKYLRRMSELNPNARRECV
ncbi:hypothetical protein DdX_00781 [Ditylenchus destructor]|uniref:Transmembrane protein n=1 Tax=Ditylenchus destructor TaxID=166010 RepID=A0AAD4RD94_9BILA|nr:hypothetical protein DdX_00781 [Ditylenchus destructor]